MEFLVRAGVTRTTRWRPTPPFNVTHLFFVLYSLFSIFTYTTYIEVLSFDSIRRIASKTTMRATRTIRISYIALILPFVVPRSCC